MTKIIALTILIFFAIISVIECIINGIPAQGGMFPYMAGLMIKEYNILNCGGAVISTRLILTTAHCICFHWSHEYYYILVGTNNIKSGGSRYETERSICYEQFIPEAAAHDIGMVKTTRAITFGIEVMLIALQSQPIPPGEYITATGWGCMTSTRNTYPDDLRYDFLEVENPEECHNKYWTNIEFNFVCSKAGRYHGTCSGDSGGPAIYEGRLAGLSYLTANNSPDLFVDVSYYIPWIIGQAYAHNRDENDIPHDESNEYYNYTNIFLREKNKLTQQGVHNNNHKPKT